jgi:rare lipoprotein A
VSLTTARRWACGLALLGLTACAPHRPLGAGLASWYGPGLAGRPTASGQTFRPTQLTAAHRSLPFGTVVRVEHLASGRTVRVVINDRGPFVAGRLIDLSRAAARRLGMIEAGLAEVALEVVGCRQRLGCER